MLDLTLVLHTSFLLYAKCVFDLDMYRVSVEEAERDLLQRRTPLLLATGYEPMNKQTHIIA